MGVSVCQPRDQQLKAVHDLTQNTLEKRDAPVVPPNRILGEDSYVGEGYGILAASTREAIILCAQTKG